MFSFLPPLNTIHYLAFTCAWTVTNNIAEKFKFTSSTRKSLTQDYIKRVSVIKQCLFFTNVKSINKIAHKA